MNRSHLSPFILAMSAAAFVPVFAAADKGTGSNAPPAPPVPETQLAPAADAPKPVVAGSVFAIRADVPMPIKTSKRGGGPSPYPFDQLEVNQSFGLAEKTKKSMNSTIHTANVKYREPILNVDGTKRTEVKVWTDKNGAEKRKTVELFNEKRRFESVVVDPKTDPDGASLRIYRVK